MLNKITSTKFFDFGSCLLGWWFVVGIVRDFEEIVLVHEDKLSLSDFVDFSKQLASAGYVLNVGNNVSYLRLGFEKPTLIDLLKRFVAFVTQKKLSLSQAQKFVFSEPEKVKTKMDLKEEPTTLVYKPYGKIVKYYN